MNRKDGVAVFMIPGIHNTAEGIFGDNLIPYCKEAGYEYFPYEFPLRNVPLSQEPPEEVGQQTLRSDINDFHNYAYTHFHGLQDNCLKVLIDHSRGNVVALDAAQYLHFDLIFSITGSGINGIRMLNSFVFKNISSYLKAILLNKPAGRSEELMRKLLDPEISDENCKKLYNSLVWESGAAIWDLIFRQPQINPSFIECPVVFIGGKRDKLVTEDKIDQMVAIFNGKAKKKMFDTGHYPFWGEERDNIIDFIDNKIKSHLN